MAHPSPDPFESSNRSDASDLGSHHLGTHGPDLHGETGLRAQVASIVELMEADPNDLTVGERMDALRAIAALSGQVDAAMCRHAAVFDAHLDYLGDGARTAPAWVGARTETHSNVAREDVKRGRKLWSCPLVEDAYRCGVIGTAKVNAVMVARDGVEALFAEQERLVVSIITDMTIAHAQRYLARWRETALATVGGDDDKAPADIAPDSLHVSATFKGRRAINGDLNAIIGAELEGMLEAEVTAKFASGEYRADDGMLPSQRNAQALLAMCRRGALASTVAGEARPSVTILIDLASLLGIPVRNAADLLNRRCQLADGTVISLEKVLELSADATLNAVLGAVGIDGKFHPVGEIRDTRSANARQRRALAVRDQGCIFTGCDRPAAWSHAHHIDTWHATHQTTVPRLALLCSFHHHRIHDHGFTLDTDLDGKPTIRRPDGTLLPTPPPGYKIPPDPPPGEGAGPPDVTLFDDDDDPPGESPPISWSSSNRWSTQSRPADSGFECDAATCGWDEPATDYLSGQPGNGPVGRPSTIPSSRSEVPSRAPSRFQPLARKRSRTQIRTDVCMEQALSKLAAITNRPRG